MKYLKMLGLAAVATMVVMALIGTGTASAAGGVLCEGIKEPCGEGNEWKKGDPTTFNLIAHTKTSFLATPAGEILAACEESQFAGKVLNQGTEKARASVEVAKEGLTWGKCTSTTTTVTPGELEYEYIASEKGTLGTVFAKNLVIKVALFGVQCYYKDTANTGTDIGRYIPGSAGTGDLVVNAVTEKESSSVHNSSFLCPSSVIWQGEYTLAGEKALYIKGK